MSAWLDLRALARDLRPELSDPEQVLGPAGATVREAAVATWRARMVNEHGSAPVFEALARQATAARLHEEAQCFAGFADEERYHGALCGAVVEALGGEAVAAIDAPTPVPMHDEVAPLEALLRNVISVCCMGETIAVALIAAERLQMPDGPLRELLTRILADEVGHARAGWRLLERHAGASLGPDARTRLARYVEIAITHQRAHQFAHLPLSSCPPAAASAWGLCNGREARALCDDTIARVVVPGLARLGLANRDRAR